MAGFRKTAMTAQLLRRREWVLNALAVVVLLALGVV